MRSRRTEPAQRLLRRGHHVGRARHLTGALRKVGSGGADHGLLYASSQPGPTAGRCSRIGHSIDDFSAGLCLSVAEYVPVGYVLGRARRVEHDNVAALFRIEQVFEHGAVRCDTDPARDEQELLGRVERERKVAGDLPTKHRRATIQRVERLLELLPCGEKRTLRRTVSSAGD